MSLFYFVTLLSSLSFVNDSSRQLPKKLKSIELIVSGQLLLSFKYTPFIINDFFVCVFVVLVVVLSLILDNDRSLWLLRTIYLTLDSFSV